MNSNHTSMEDNEIDRIGDLPEGILEHILSFLPTKEAVKTSVISKRWRNSWAFSPRIDFSDNEFRSSENFIRFGNMVLLRRETPCLHTFSLSCHDKFFDKCYFNYIRRWINLVMRFKPRVCCIEAVVPHSDFLISAFTCESIEDMSLKIHKPQIDIIPTTVNLPHIKRLCLNGSYLDEEKTTRLFTGCPVLEDLTLKGCCGDFSSIFKLKKLIYLSLIDCRCKGFHPVLPVPTGVDLSCIRRLFITKLHLYEVSSGRLLIGCPLLESLSLENCSGKFSCIFRDKPKCLSLWGCNTSRGQVQWYIDKALVKLNSSGDTEVLIVCTLQPSEIKLIWEPTIGTELDFHKNFNPSVIFSGAECLKLCFPNAKVDLKKEFQKSGLKGAFKKLKSLSLVLADWCLHHVLKDPVTWFLQKSPNIEELTLYNPKRKILLSKKGNPNLVDLDLETSYYDFISMVLSGMKNLKQVEIKLCKNVFAVDSFKETLLRNMKCFVNAKVVISKF
ncbi:F-box/RNI-like/FBD-like domains-containing protein [Rhynchospora pubera]|uniref:F-box/RNI-like/FBD-like domains-containing protein n=1 Tax=Rhynchospora pubera TaxID=906938 RepID=A0AAV8C412_9POAL|nr:F-box/RNI-like/FBD-like domains-containing protein [Rhynchospora pubera]